MVNKEESEVKLHDPMDDYFLGPPFDELMQQEAPQPPEEPGPSAFALAIAEREELQRNEERKRAA